MSKKKSSTSIKARRAQMQAKQQRQRRIYYASAAVGAIVIIALFALIRQINAPELVDVIVPDNLEPPAQADGKAWGPADAPVVIEEFADFQCPFCGRFATTIEHQLAETYADSGLVRFEFNHFAFLGFESVEAAEASECANEQGLFWPYHDVVFTNQRGENIGAFSRPALINFAETAGLDTDTFESCLASNKFDEIVETEIDEARARGVQSTPTLFINGEIYEGSMTFEDIRATIEAELAATS